MKIADVAAALGISKGTVSRAITGHGRISPATRHRVLTYMDEHGFRPNTIAQSLSQRRTWNIAFTVPSEHDFAQMPFFLECLISASQAAAVDGCDILVVNNTDSDVARLVAQQKVDGVIVSRNMEDAHILDELSQSNTPFVLLGTTTHLGGLQIDYDHRAACRELTAVLTKRWSGAPGLIMGDRHHIVSQARANGFADAAPTAPIIWDATDETSIDQAFAALYDAGVRTFFCGDDMICCVLEQNLTTGAFGSNREPVRVASFYDSQTLRTLHPQVPVLHFDTSELGARACRMLLAQIAGQDVANVTLAHQLVLPDDDLVDAMPTPMAGPPTQPTKYPTPANRP